MIALIIGIVWGILGFIFFVLITKRVEKIGEEDGTETPNWKVAVLVCGCGPYLWFIVLVSVIGNFAIEHISKWLVKK